MSSASAAVADSSVSHSNLDLRSGSSSSVQSATPVPSNLPQLSTTQSATQRFFNLVSPSAPVDSTEFRLNFPQWLDQDLRASIESITIGNPNNTQSHAAHAQSPSSRPLHASSPLNASSSLRKSGPLRLSDQVQQLAEEVHRKKLETKKAVKQANEKANEEAKEVNTDSSTQSVRHESIDATVLAARSPFALLNRSSTLRRSHSKTNPGQSPSPRKKFPPHVPGSQYCLNLGLHDHWNPVPLNPAAVLDLAWFDEIEHKLKELSNALQSSQHNDTDQNELNRLKYAVLIQRLEEMNRVHKELLLDEKQKLLNEQLKMERERELRYLEQIQMSERQIREQLFADREKERAMETAEKEHEKGLYDQLMSGKEAMIRELMSENGELKRELIELKGKMDWLERHSKETSHLEVLKEREDRERERNEWERNRIHWSRQLEVLQNDRQQYQRELNQLKMELDSERREMRLKGDELMNQKYQLRECQERVRDMERERDKYIQLQKEYSLLQEEMERRELVNKEERMERDQLLNRLMKQLKEWELREERRRKWLKERNLLKNSGRKYEDMMDSPLDSAWASGPVDRQSLLF